MKTFKLLAIAVIAILFASCKASQPTGPPSGGTALVSQVGQTLDTIENQFMLEFDSTNSDDHAALQRTGNWLAGRTNIQSVSVLDSTYLYFTLQSGLTGMYYLDEVDDSGMSLTRGGPGGGGSLSKWSVLSAKTISNTNVLIFAPVFNEFYSASDFQYVLNILQNSGLNLNVTVVKDSACSATIVNQFGNFGLVIMDTHGAPNGFLIGTVLPDTLMSDETRTKLLINVNMGTMGYDMFQAGQAMLSRGLTIGAPKSAKKQIKKPVIFNFAVVLTGKFVQTIPNVSGTVIFGNMCYSGQSTPATQGPALTIQSAFTSLNPISYYGYAYSGGGSATVYNGFAKRMEDSLLTQLITNTDSTGHCYLQQNGSEYYDSVGLVIGYSKQNLYFKHWGADNYSYVKCGDTLVDPRDGQKYATVCIGSQKWMAQNLNYNAPGSIACDSIPGFGALFGRLYDTATYLNGAKPSTSNPSGVQGICPYGWHIPSDSEWSQLFNIFGASNHQIGDALSVSVPGYTYNTSATNASGFSATPAGFFYYGTPGGPPILSCPPALELFATSSRNTQGHMDGIQIDQTGDIQNNAIVGGSCRCVKDP